MPFIQMNFIREFFVKTFLPDIQTLAKKNSDISTKKYIDLGVFIHCMFLSAILFPVLLFFREFELASYHIVAMLGWSLSRGLLAKKGKLDETNS